METTLSESAQKRIRLASNLILLCIPFMILFMALQIQTEGFPKTSQDWSFSLLDLGLRMSFFHRWSNDVRKLNSLITNFLIGIFAVGGFAYSISSIFHPELLKVHPGKIIFFALIFVIFWLLKSKKEIRDLFNPNIQLTN